MKPHLAAQLRVTAILMALALGSLLSLAPKPVEAADSAPQKIRLMAETLRARDSGDLATAKAKAEELIRLAPNDENVQRLLASINNEIERRGGGTALYGQAAGTDVEDAMLAGPLGAEAKAQALANEQGALIAAAENAIEEAERMTELGAYADATALLNEAQASLPLNTATADTLEAIDEAKASVLLAEARALANAGDPKAAEAMVSDYRAAGGESRKADSLARKLDAQISDPYAVDIEEVSPAYAEQADFIRDLLTRGRAQYLNGDYDGAAATFKAVEARDPNNAEAKFFLTEIAGVMSDIHSQNRYKTREQMLAEVEQNWDRPKVFDVERTITGQADTGNRTLQKLTSIKIPQVNFSGMELTRVIETLSELSLEYDPDREGVNIVPLFNPNEQNPRVNISLRNLSLDRILEFVTQQVNFAYDVGSDAVTVSPSDASGGNASMVTEFFPITRATVIRLTGVRDGGGASAAPVDPFAPPSGGGGGGSSQGEDTEQLRSFFQSAGVNFDIPGASMAFDGEQLIVTQTTRNLERMRTILRNYNEVKQVEIEAKFLEVNQGDLDELGFDWNVSDGANPVFSANGLPVLDDNGDQLVTYDRQFSTGNRTINEAFGISSTSSAITINGDPVAQNSAPTLASAIDLASSAGRVFTASGWSLNGYDVDLAIRALARKSGSDLMSAPKVTVLSGKRATITVAQELRYPESYSDIESTVSESGGTLAGGGSAAVSITAGTPQDFVPRNIGVEMAVTPNVENDDTISLILEPRVTEFEGFVEYGGPSVAIAGGTTVTVPAGFYQPVFSTREITTEVTVFDGATVVMGGLTRDEVKYVNDKVPVLGDIPGVGRLFRSEGESRQKRNLLIFVTANLISPGGSPAKQSYRTVEPNSLFQNPVIQTPGGSANRAIDVEQ